VEVTWTKVKLFSRLKKSSEEVGDLTYIRKWCLEDRGLDWVLITNLSFTNKADAIRIVNIYQKRRLIEDYHKAVKTGFRIEDNQLKQASRILALFGMIAVIATQLLGMREHCPVFSTTLVEEKIPKRWITLVERYLKVKIKTVREFWRALA